MSNPTPAPDALWVERTGTRTYTGFNGRGGRVSIAPIDAPDAFSPGELLKIALAGCTGLTADAPLARRLGDDFDATIHVSGAKDLEADRYPELVERLEVDLSGLDAATRERLLTVVHRTIEQSCTVSRTITGGTTVSLDVVSPEPA